MQDQYNVREILHQHALNSEEDKTGYFDLHDDSLVTHGVPENFSADNEGMKEYYHKVCEPFLVQDMNLNVLLSMETKLHVCFPLPGIQRDDLMGIPPSDKQLRIKA
jgi:hypothetical protein